MMIKKKSNPWARLKYLYVLPLAAVAVAAFARPEVSNQLDEISSVKVNDLTSIVKAEEVKSMENSSDEKFTLNGQVMEYPSKKPVPGASVVVRGTTHGTLADAEDLVIELKKMVLPQYPGGMAECMKFLAKNIKYPKKARENGIQGRVILQFWVETDGSIDDIKIVKGVSWDLNDEAKRVVKKMPKFKPGTIGGEPTRMQFNMPIIFRLS